MRSQRQMDCSPSRMASRRYLHTASIILSPIAVLFVVWSTVILWQSSHEHGNHDLAEIFQFSPHRSSSTESGLHCGVIPDQALPRSCTYDVVSGAWVHHRCHDIELEESFLAIENWTYYADSALKEPITLSEIRSTGGPASLFITPGSAYHDWHCAYTWKKLHRAILGSGMIDGHIGSVQHTLHCANSVARDRSKDTSVAVFDRISTSCRELGDYRETYAWQVQEFGTGQSGDHGHPG